MKSATIIFTTLAIMAPAFARPAPQVGDFVSRVLTLADFPSNNPPPAPAPVDPAAGNTGGIDLALVPDFGVERGVPVPGTGDCVGSVPGVLIPCRCPPSKEEYAQKLQEFLAAGQTPAGAPVSNPTGSSNEDQIARINTAIVVLQSFTGRPGDGCPASSTTLLAQRAALQG